MMVVAMAMAMANEDENNVETHALVAYGHAIHTFLLYWFKGATIAIFFDLFWMLG